MSLALPVIGGLLALSQLRPGAWGDPKKLTQQYAPAGLLDSMSEEEQAERGQMLQRQLRNPLTYRSKPEEMFQKGLLDEYGQRQAAQRQTANRGILDMYAQQGVLQPHEQALLANNPELMEHFFKERYTGRNLTPGSTFYSGGVAEYQTPNRPQSVGNDLVDPDTGRLIHRAPPNPGTTVNVGDQGGRWTIHEPTGRAFGYDPQGNPISMVIPGAQADVESQERATEQETQRSAQAAIAGFTLRDARAIMDNVDNMSNNALVRRGLANIPGTTEYEVQRDIESLRGTISIEQLLNIKRQGAGLGQVPQAQLDMLSRLMGELDIARDPARLKQLVQDIQDRYMEILAMIPEEEREMVGIAQREYDAIQQQGQPQQAPQTTPQAPQQAPAVRKWNPEAGRLE